MSREDIEYNLVLNIEDATTSIRQMERMAMRTMHVLSMVLKNIGAGDNVQNAIRAMEKLLMTIRMIQVSLHFLSLATPYGYVMGATAIVGLFAEAAYDGNRGR